MTYFLKTLANCFLLSLITGSVTFLAAQTTCPPITLLSTPRIMAADRQVIVSVRQADGSFMGYNGPRLAPYFVGGTVQNLQAAITSCYPGPTKKGSAAFSSLNRAGWASHLGDWADLDGDGIEDAVMIYYKPNLVYTLRFTASGVLKSGSPSPVIVNGTPLTVRLADVNKDGYPDLIIAAGAAPDQSSPSAIWVVLNKGDGTFGAPTRFAAGTEPLGFAVIDVNGDGNLDLVVADQGSANGSGGGGVAVLFGNGAGSFSAPSILNAGAGATSVVVGDFNGDGKLDIAATTGNLVSLYPGNGNGAFGTRVTFPGGGDGMYLAMGDFNADGKLDLVVSNYQEQTASVLINNGTGSTFSFQTPVSYVISLGRSPDYLVVTDFNNDGIPDIIGGTGFPSTFAGNSNNAIDVLLGNGDGTFAAPTVVQVGSAPLAFAVAGDFNGDGKMDVAAMVKNSTNLLFFAGHGDGTFAAPITSALGNTSFSNAVGAVAGDFNGDGVADLAIVTTNGFAIALSQKNGSFQPLNTIYRSALSTAGVVVGDFNGDGKLDVATSLCTYSGGTTSIHIYNGNGSGGFTDTLPFNLNYCPDALLTSDLNGDTKPDLVSLNNVIPFSGAYSSADIILNQGKGAFAAPKTYPLDPNGRVLLTLLDVNGDGKPDLVAAASFSTPLETTTLLNNGDGTFGNRIFNALATPPLALIGADLNGDGKGDLILPPSPTAHVVTNDLAFATGNGDGTFQTPIHFAGPNTTNLQFADFNNDGHPDLLAGSAPNAPGGYFMVILTGAPPAAPPPALTTVNGASFTASAPVAADSIATAFGSHLAVASNLGGTTVAVKDFAGTSRPGTIFFASAGQVNFQVPPGTANGSASVTITASDGTATAGTVQVANVAPGMFAANAGGLYAGSVLRVQGDGSQNPENSYQLDASNNVVPLPVSLGPATDQVFLILYGTGIRHAANVTATIAGQKVPVAFAGAQGAFIGEDQINLGPLPQALAGSGVAKIVVTADGQVANTVTLTIQ